MSKAIKIFTSYAHEDEKILDAIKRQLRVYERSGKIIHWHDRLISPGTEWKKEIDFNLRSSDIVLLLMTPHFIESNYCYEIEGRTALEMHEEGIIEIAAIIGRPCAWEETPFSKFQAIPSHSRPISQWGDIDEATLDVAFHVKKLVDKISNKPDKHHLLQNQIRASIQLDVLSFVNTLSKTYGLADRIIRDEPLKETDKLFNATYEFLTTSIERGLIATTYNHANNSAKK